MDLQVYRHPSDHIESVEVSSVLFMPSTLTPGRAPGYLSTPSITSFSISAFVVKVNLGSLFLGKLLHMPLRVFTRPVVALACTGCTLTLGLGGLRPWHFIHFASGSLNSIRSKRQQPKFAYSPVWTVDLGTRTVAEVAVHLGGQCMSRGREDITSPLGLGLRRYLATTSSCLWTRLH